MVPECWFTTEVWYYRLYGKTGGFFPSNWILAHWSQAKEHPKQTEWLIEALLGAFPFWMSAFDHVTPFIHHLPIYMPKDLQGSVCISCSLTGCSTRACCHSAVCSTHPLLMVSLSPCWYLLVWAQNPCSSVTFAEHGGGRKEMRVQKWSLIYPTNTDHTAKQTAAREDKEGLRTETNIFWKLGAVKHDEEPQQLTGRELGAGGGSALSHALGRLSFFNTHIKNKKTHKVS